MIYDLTTAIAKKFTGDWVDRATGLARVIDGKPYAHTVDPNDCAADLLLSPDERYKTLLYFDYVADAREDFELENGATVYKLPVRLIAWVNGRALGDDSGEISSEVIRDIQRQVRSWGTFNLEEFSSVRVKVTKIGDKNFKKVFGKYGANEEFKGFYLAPNDFLSMELEIEFIANCGTFVAGDPTCGEGGNNFPPGAGCDPAQILDGEGNVLFEVDSGGTETLEQIRISGSGAIALDITGYSNGTIGTFTLTQVIEAFAALSEGNDPGNAQAIADGLDANLSAELQALICAACAEATVTAYPSGSYFSIPSGGEQRVDGVMIQTAGSNLFRLVNTWQSVNRSFTGPELSLTAIIQGFSDYGTNESTYAAEIAAGLSTALSAALQDLICPTPADGNIEVNGNAYGTVASGDTENVLVQYENGTPIGTIDGSIVKIPDPVTVSTVPRPIYITEPLAASTDNGDLKWQFDQGYHDYQDGDITGQVRKLGGDHYTLHADTPNHWGNTNRYTFENDGSNAWTGTSFTVSAPVGSTDYVIVDHLYDRVILMYNIGNGTWSGFMTAAMAWSLSVWDWRPITQEEFIACCLPGRSNGMATYYDNKNLLRRNSGPSPGVAGAYVWFAETRTSNSTQAFRSSSSCTKEIRSKTDSSTLNEYYVIANYTPIT